MMSITTEIYINQSQILDLKIDGNEAFVIQRRNMRNQNSFTPDDNKL